MARKYEPSPQDRTMVEAMAGYGITEADIARVIKNPETDRPITVKTLRKHFREEIRTGAIKATAKVAESLYKQATQKGHVTAQIFWLKTRARWKETQKHEHEHSGTIDVQGLTNEQLEYLARHGELQS